MDIKNFIKDHKKEVIITTACVVGGITVLGIGHNRIAKAGVNPLVVDDELLGFMNDIALSQKKDHLLIKSLCEALIEGHTPTESDIKIYKGIIKASDDFIEGLDKFVNL